MNMPEKLAIYDQISEKPVLGLQSASRLFSLRVVSCLDDTMHV